MGDVSLWKELETHVRVLAILIKGRVDGGIAILDGADEALDAVWHLAKDSIPKGRPGQRDAGGEKGRQVASHGEGVRDRDSGILTVATGGGLTSVSREAKN